MGARDFDAQNTNLVAPATSSLTRRERRDMGLIRGIQHSREMKAIHRDANTLIEKTLVGAQTDVKVKQIATGLAVALTQIEIVGQRQIGSLATTSVKETAATHSRLTADAAGVRLGIHDDRQRHQAEIEARGHNGLSAEAVRMLEEEADADRDIDLKLARDRALATKLTIQEMHDGWIESLQRTARSFR
ncbi:MAG: hypothetical protein AB7P02_27305 [Alphaproteobacteria bacterium]